MAQNRQTNNQQGSREEGRDSQGRFTGQGNLASEMGRKGGERSSRGDKQSGNRTERSSRGGQNGDGSQNR